MHSKSLLCSTRNEKELLCNLIPSFYFFSLLPIKTKWWRYERNFIMKWIWSHRSIYCEEFLCNFVARTGWINEEHIAFIVETQSPPESWVLDKNVHIQAHHKYFNNWKHWFLINGRTRKSEASERWEAQWRIFQISIPIEFNILRPVRSSQLFINERSHRSFVTNSNHFFVRSFLLLSIDRWRQLVTFREKSWFDSMTKNAVDHATQKYFFRGLNFFLCSEEFWFLVRALNF